MKKALSIFELKHELSQNTPDVWKNIQKKISQQIANKLIRDLEGLPSPKGRLYGELIENVKQKCFTRGA